MGKLIPQVGDKVVGVKFSDEKFVIPGYDHDMDKHIGEVGEVVTLDNSDNTFRVKFEEDTTWWYPTKLFKKMVQPVVGMEVVGVEFEDEKFGRLHYAKSMDLYIGERGKIVEILDDGKRIHVRFKSKDREHYSWTYPIEVFPKMLKKARNKKTQLPVETIEDTKEACAIIEHSKSLDEPIDLRGSGAVAASADIVLSIQRTERGVEPVTIDLHKIQGWQDHVIEKVTVEPSVTTPLQNIRIPAYAVVDMETGKSLGLYEYRDVARSALQEIKSLYHKNHKLVKLKVDKFVR